MPHRSWASRTTVSYSSAGPPAGGRSSRGLERDVPAGLGPRDARLFAAFKQRYERLAALAERVGLELLCERILSEHDYDLAVLARWDGSRRYANLRKLARLARSYEELRGPDIEGFVRFLRDQEAAGAKEVEAVAEEEGGDAIRLLTIHAAKGLEFKVVVIADAGRGAPASSPDEILCLPDGRFGFRFADPATGHRRPVFGYDDVREAERAAEEEESRRVYYVAMTRAIDRLVISGALDPTSRRDAATPIAWVLDRVGADLADEGPTEIERDGARVLVRVDTGARAREDEPAAASESQLALFTAEANGAVPAGVELPPLAPVAEPPAHPVRTLSYSALALFEHCSYRFYAERIVGMRPAAAAGTVPGTAGLAATEIGDAVHDLLEHAAADGDARTRVVARYPGATDADLERIETLIDAWRGSPLARRLAADGHVRLELPFAFELDGVLVRGRFDAFRLVDGRALVVDYKTNALDELAPAEIVEAEYVLQRLVYALAAFRAGAREVEVAYVFLERPEDVVVKTFTGDDLPELEAALSDAIATIQRGDFRPTPSDFACPGCPALDVVCAGPRLPRAVAPVTPPVAAAS
ncbi:MAG TPA: PD-(D/E)XK nuclease family protein [Gaiellaceae bacterium]|nr:PD-(D/E)XK nuclease family protein [Gaiellaceae bacterium]